MKEQAIKVDILLETSGDFAADAALIRNAETLGFETAWITERQHNPFFPPTIAADQITTIGLGTLGAAAFPRSPMVSAQIAWDLSRQSRGRFSLGLGIQSSEDDVADLVDEQNNHVSRMREYIESLRAIWNTFQSGDRLRFRGRYYQFRLMAPFFNPGPIDHPDIPIYLYADAPEYFELAGEICQGLQLPVLHTERYLRDMVLPAVERGLQKAGRTRPDIRIIAPVMIATGSTWLKTEAAKRTCQARIARFAKDSHSSGLVELFGGIRFFDSLLDSADASDRSEGWLDVGDEILSQLAIVAELDDIADAIRARYQGLADCVAIFWNDQDPQLMASIVSSLLG